MKMQRFDLGLTIRNLGQTMSKSGAYIFIDSWKLGRAQLSKYLYPKQQSDFSRYAPTFRHSHNVRAFMTDRYSRL